MWYSLIGVFIGFLLDFIFGDPQVAWHPIRLMGKLIDYTKRILCSIFSDTPFGALIGGIFLVLIVSGVSVLLPSLLLYMLFQWNVYVGIIGESILCYQMMATKSLKTESTKVYEHLLHNDIPGARHAVSMIVGRDTDNLLKEDIIKATVETIGENTCDGSIAPLFYMMIGGPLLGIFYKSINTMDSMVGYKNEEYLYFGRAAARLDDVLNYIPARLSAGFMLLSTLFMKLNIKNAWKIYLRDRYNHSSPNSAHTEAVMAGALSVQLGGDAWYFGTLYSKKTIGDPIRSPIKEDIPAANKLLYLTAILGMVICASIKIGILFILS